jgi:hypothetical protein
MSITFPDPRFAMRGSRASVRKRSFEARRDDRVKGGLVDLRRWAKRKDDDNIR